MTTVVIDGWLLTRRGIGMAVYAKRLVEGLLRLREPRVDVRILIPDASLLDGISVGPEHLVSLPLARTPFILLDQMRWQLRVGTHVRNHWRDDIFFSPGPFWCPSSPKRTIVTFHDCIYRHFPLYQGRWILRKWLLRKREQFLLHCEAVITESDYAAGEIRELLDVPDSRIHMIPAWLPPNYTPQISQHDVERIRAKYALPEKFWLYVGGYDYRKNVEILIEAYASARQTAACPPLVLAGTIPTDLSKPVCRVDETIQRTRLDRNCVITPGFIAEPDLPGVYAAADLFVYPSLQEGFGLPPLEAMGCGCPTLCADNSSLREVVRYPAYRFDPRAPNALADLLTQAAESTMPLNPQFATVDFDEASAMRQYVDLFERVNRDTNSLAHPA